MSSVEMLTFSKMLKKKKKKQPCCLVKMCLHIGYEFQCDFFSKQNATCGLICLDTKISVILPGRIHWTHFSSSTTEYRHDYRVRGTYSLSLYNMKYSISPAGNK